MTLQPASFFRALGWQDSKWEFGSVGADRAITLSLPAHVTWRLYRKRPRLKPGAHQSQATLPDAAGPTLRGRQPRGQAATTPPRGGPYRRTGGGGDRSRRHRSNSFWKRKAARNPFFTPRTGGAEVRTAGARRQRGPRGSSSLTSPDAIAEEKAMDGGRKKVGTVSR